VCVCVCVCVCVYVCVCVCGCVCVLAPELLLAGSVVMHKHHWVYKLSYSTLGPVSTGMGDHFWWAYHHGM